MNSKQELKQTEMPRWSPPATNKKQKPLKPIYWRKMIGAGSRGPLSRKAHMTLRLARAILLPPLPRFKKTMTCPHCKRRRRIPKRSSPFTKHIAFYCRCGRRLEAYGD